MSLRITKRQLNDLIREVEFQKKRVRKALDLFGERIGWRDTYKRMELLLEVLSALKRRERIEIVKDEEVSDDDGVYSASAMQQRDA